MPTGNANETVRLLAFLAAIGLLGVTNVIDSTTTAALLSALLGYAFGQHSGEARANAGRAAVAASQAAQAAATDAHAIVLTQVKDTDEHAKVPDAPGKVEPRSVG